MKNNLRLFIENVRCFAGRHIAPLAPITILVGENSTGKSTFLAACRLAFDALHASSLNLNDEPFELGAFNDFVSAADQKGSYFALGYVLEKSQTDVPPLGEIEVNSKIILRVTETSVAEHHIKCGDYQICFRRVGENEAANEQIIDIRTPSGGTTTTLVSVGVFDDVILNGANILRYMRIARERDVLPETTKVEIIKSQPTNEDLKQIERILVFARKQIDMPRPYAIAPVRTKPKRTYDLLTDKPRPEGDHAPMILAKLRTSSHPVWRDFAEALIRFGHESGLFNYLDVKTFGGDGPGVPFQIRVGWSKEHDFNLIDVGYGVSQVLPILVDAMRSSDRMLLLQQPEVHLHPRAQAELGSFLAKLAALRSLPIVIETHSDYLLDRIRLLIRDGRELRASDVSLLYFEREGASVQIKPISIDDHGNLVNAPATYRSFFLKEENWLLNG